MIIQTNFETILTIWQNRLWPNRTSKIETNSAMLLDRTYNMDNFKYATTYHAFLIKDKIVGCNSGHMCADNSYRSRGLYVFEEYRGQGIGVELLLATIEQAREENADIVWSYPRDSSWNTYKKAGFELSSPWENSELGINAYCKLQLR